MPESGNQPYNQQIPDRAGRPAPRTAEWNINVVPEPRAESRVPAAVEIADAGGRVRVVKVLDEIKAQQHRGACRDQRISPEVVVQPEGIPVCAKPCERR